MPPKKVASKKESIGAVSAWVSCSESDDFLTRLQLIDVGELADDSWRSDGPTQYLRDQNFDGSEA